jgi:hypothetical protein
MTVFKKLQAARLELVNSGIKKTGKNDFGGWKYYELGDFIPAIHKIFDKVGLCGVFTFGEMASLTIYDTEGEGKIEFSTPVVYAESAKGQPIQQLGSTHTYLRRYCWLMAMEIVEADLIEAEEQEVKDEPVKVDLPKPKAKQKPLPIPPPFKNDMVQWEIKVIESTEETWIDLIMDAAKVCLEITKSAEDVQNIYRVNRTIFDKLKAEYPDQHDELLDLFKKEKQSFTKE